MNGLIDGRKAQKISRYLREIAKSLVEEPKKLQKKYEKRVKDELYDSFYEVMSEFYSSYEPWLYKRHSKGLELLLEIEIKNGKVIGSLDATNLPSHRVSNDYIYDTVFKEGWHGGASKGPWSPGTTLYYRKPTPRQASIQGIPAYSKWGRKAERSGFSPKDESINRMNDKMLELNTEYNQEFQSILNNAFQKYKSIM